jgi:hypothetical protein
MVDRLGEIHSFADVAVQWLVPEPLFEVVCDRSVVKTVHNIELQA